MIEPVSGLVIRYAYLWAREKDRGEESGRKSRPVCVQILFAGTTASTRTLLFPITSQPPGADARALAIPQMEARRIGIRLPAWIIVNEWNEDDIETTDCLAAVDPLGAFGKTFVQRIRDEVIAAIKARHYRAVDRR